jgi:serine protease AprX
MKSICNFYKNNKKVVFTLIFGFIVSFSNAQTQKSANEKLQESALVYDKNQKGEVERFVKQGYKRIIESKNGEYSELVGTNAVGKPLYLLTGNNNVVNGISANVLQNGFDGFKLEGDGSRIALWENGQPRRAHEMFRTTVAPSNLLSRIEYAPGQNLTLQRHATHISGTLIGNQYLPSATSPSNSLVRGLAFKSTIKAWDWLNVTAEMITAATVDNIKIANTSFGFNPLYLNEAEFGRYNETAKQWDRVMCANKEFQIVKSVGNARDDFDINNYPQYPQVNVLDGYDLLEGAGVSKNVLVVGSVNLENGSDPESGDYFSSSINEPYSSWGPTDDGRIKPDLVAHGNKVRSSLETQNNTYGLYSGTSQAAAGVTGGITLLQEYWKKKIPTNMWSSTIRALLIHNAEEIDDRGPDYRNGWGFVNIEKSAITIRERGKSVIIREDVLTNGKTIKLNLAATGNEDLKVTIAWTDPEGIVVPIDPQNPNPYINEIASKLINDIDIRLIRRDTAGNVDTTLLDKSLTSPNDNVLFPWKMKEQIAGNTTLTLDAIAERGDNDRDNVEKIEVYNNLIPNTGGMYQLQITHKGTLLSGCETGQPFSLVISGVSFCKDNLVFLQNQDNELTDGVGTKVIANTIKASNIIKAVSPFQITNPDFVEYQAADFIELLPQTADGGNGSKGFTAELGSDFYAHIDCTTDTNQRMAFSAHDIQTIVNDTRIENRIKVDQGEMVVFPNPLLDGLLNIQFSLLKSSTLSLRIYDTIGRLIFTDNSQSIYNTGLNKKTIDLNFLPTATYILQTETKDGNRQIRFIKK